MDPEFLVPKAALWSVELFPVKVSDSYFVDKMNISDVDNDVLYTTVIKVKVKSKK